MDHEPYNEYEKVEVYNQKEMFELSSDETLNPSFSMVTVSQNFGFKITRL